MVTRRSRQPIRLLLVGYGVRGRQWHSECERRSEVRVVGVVDPDEQARSAADAAGVPSWRVLPDALARIAADGAIVASPPAEHPRDAATCLSAGLGVLAEKPLAFSLRAAAELAEASSKAARPLLVGQNFRFLRRERTVRKLLTGGRLGEPRSAVIVSARPESAARPHLRSIERGPIWDICLHHLDAVRSRFAVPPARVDARARRSPDGRSTTFSIDLEWQDGFHTAYRHTEGSSAYFYSEWLEGERSAVSVVNQGVRLVYPDRRPRPVLPVRGARPESALLAGFVAALRGRVPRELTGEDNLATVAIIEAVIRALDLGRPIDLAELDVEADAGALPVRG